MIVSLPVDEFPERTKPIAATRLKPVVLSFVNDQDFSHIAHGFDIKSLRKNRLSRRVDEAFDQLYLISLTLLYNSALPMQLSVSMSKKLNPMDISCLLEGTFTISPVQSLIKEKSSLFTYKVTLLQILLLKLTTLSKLSIATSKTIIAWRFYGSTTLKIPTKSLIPLDFLRELFSSILIFYRLNSKTTFQRTRLIN